MIPEKYRVDILLAKAFKTISEAIKKMNKGE